MLPSRARHLALLLLVACVPALASAGPAVAAPPYAMTLDPSIVAATSATLRGHGGSSDNGPFTYWFEYGPTAAYGTSSPEGSSPANGSVESSVGGLSPSTTYNYRFVVKNAEGTAFGENATFTTPAPPPDADGDGFPDSSDQCPSTPGVAQGPHNRPGCPVPPDTDGDGYVDPGDYCPSQPGAAEGPDNLQGCPVPPDSDGDGFRDPKDACPSKPGPAQSANNSQGCPVPPDTDFDDDGVENQYDECPNTAGREGANGCPDRDRDHVRDSEDACPDLKGPVNEDGGADGNGCPDKDQDGVRDSEDACPTQGGSKYGGGVNDKGCPQVRAFFNFPSRDTWEMGHRKGQEAVCKDTPRMADCAWRIHVSLTADSARKLGLRNRELVDRTVKTTGRSDFFEQVTGKWRWRPSDALTDALKRHGRPVTIVLTGSYKVEGSGGWNKMDRKKVVVKPKPCGWVPYSCS